VRVNVDPDECTGCALCVDACSSEVFDLVGDLAVARQDEVLPEVDESCKQVVEDYHVEVSSVEG
jgi:ferredoxin